jgi:hypothetical protein
MQKVWLGKNMVNLLSTKEASHYLEESERDSYTPLLIAALFTIAEI